MLLVGAAVLAAVTLRGIHGKETLVPTSWQRSPSRSGVPCVLLACRAGALALDVRWADSAGAAQKVMPDVARCATFLRAGRSVH